MSDVRPVVLFTVPPPVARGVALPLTPIQIVANGAVDIGDVIQLHRETAFDPEAIEVLCKAYDGVLASLSGTNRIENTEEFVARWIIWLAQQGERCGALAQAH